MAGMREHAFNGLGVKYSRYSCNINPAIEWNEIIINKKRRLHDHGRAIIVKSGVM
jgi:hypothetical protein